MGLAEALAVERGEAEGELVALAVALASGFAAVLWGAFYFALAGTRFTTVSAGVTTVASVGSAS